MASLQPQTNVNPGKYLFVTNPIGKTGLEFGPGPDAGVATIVTNYSGILQTTNGDKLNASLWSEYPAYTNYIDMAPGGLQRITATNSQLFYNGEPLANGGNVADWSFYPADSGHIDFSGPTQRLTATDNNLVFNGVPLTTGQGENWSLYPAQQSVDMAQHNLDNAQTVNTQRLGVSTGGNLGISAPNNINFSSGNIINSTCRNTFSVAVGDPLNPTQANIIDFATNANQGTFGQINLTANPGLIGINGAVYITANGGTDPTGYTTYGGNVTITANTPINTSGVTFSSAVKISGASVVSYAGAIPTVGSFTGVNFLFGNLGVSITSDVTPPLLAPSPFTVYIYGIAGVSIPSTVIDGNHTAGLFCQDITPYSDTLTTTDLTIKGRGDNRVLLPPLIGNVVLKNVKTIDGNIYVQAPSSLNVTTEAALDIEGLVTVNGQPYVATQSWSTQKAISDVDLSGNSITHCFNVQTDEINGHPFVPVQQWSSQKAISNVDISGNSVVNVNDLQTTTINGIPYPPALVYVNVASDIPYSWFGGLMIYRGSSATQIFFTSGISGGQFQCRFINANLSGLPMQIYVNGTLLGISALKTNYTLVLAPGGVWSLYG